MPSSLCIGPRVLPRFMRPDVPVSFFVPEFLRGAEFLFMASIQRVLQMFLLNLNELNVLKMFREQWTGCATDDLEKIQKANLIMHSRLHPNLADLEFSLQCRHDPSMSFVRLRPRVRALRRTKSRYDL